jgi:hypothetical protein
VEVGQRYGREESRVCSTVLYSMHSEHVWFSLRGGPLGTTDPQVARVYCPDLLVGSNLEA